MSNDPNLGETFGGRWQVERALSSGGMGSVYVARHSHTGRQVALKVIKSEGAPSPEFAARFTRETQALAALSHPNVVTFLDSGCDQGKCFLVMELLQGRSLRELMGKPVEWRRAFRIGADVCRALAAVHKQGLVHRDLKPDNVFLQEAEGHEEIAKLIDFGIVRLQQGHSSATAATSTGAVVGTPGYISPEQLLGQDATAASDVYAVGVILYELVTGRFPFEAPTPHAMLVKQLIEPLTPPRNVLATVPAHVEKLIQHFMERDPALRTSTALGALAELQEALKLIESLAPDASTETGEAVGQLARDVLAGAAPLSASSPSPPSLPSPPSSAPPPAPPAQRPTAATGTVLPGAMTAGGTATPVRKGGRGGLAAAIVVLGAFSMCATCVVGLAVRDARREARSADTVVDGDALNVRIDGVSPDTTARIEAEARALQGADGAADVARAIGGLADTVGDAIDEQAAHRESARAERRAARAQRPTVEEAQLLVVEQLAELDCDGEPPPRLKRLEFAVASGRVRLLTPTRDNALLACLARATASFDAPTFPGAPVNVVLKDDEAW